MNTTAQRVGLKTYPDKTKGMRTGAIRSHMASGAIQQEVFFLDQTYILLKNLLISLA